MHSEPTSAAQSHDLAIRCMIRSDFGSSSTKTFATSVSVGGLSFALAMECRRPLRWARGVLRHGARGRRLRGITKGELAEACAAATELKKSDCFKVLSALAKVVQDTLNEDCKVIVPGICRIVMRTKPATKAGKKIMWGHVVSIKARPARNVVKIFPAAALKKAI